ncbi:unnamed protein product [Lymnaea stagnalis]|uniref:Nucleoporin Nup159/Nup146 N-terminal domain-containing protein n=1 Tax=Lymnaea stagnalis TaxID=6523 RepID=A0AAV2HRP4_LYMST
MANNDPPERDMKEFEFLQLCKFRVAPPGNESFIQRGKLITCSSNYGLLFYITQEGFNVVKTSELMTIDEGLGKQRSKVTIEDVPVIAKVQLGSCQVASMDVNGDGLYLAVAVNDGNKLSVLFYDIRVFADQSFAPTPFTVSPLNISPNGYLLDLSWNPGVFTMLAVCTSDGTVELVDVTDKAKIVASLKADVGASCFCWSPKGKQLLVGKKDGSLSQYDHALVEKKRWHCPNVLNGPHGVLDVVWQSTHVFVAAYLSAGSQPSDQPVVILSSANKDNVIHINFEDVCFGSGEVRRPQYFFHQVLKWEMILVASSNATEATVIGKNLDDKTSWEHWNLEDSARAQLPLTKEQNDTFPLGLTVDYSPYKPIVLSESKQLPACPVMYMLSTDGILVGFHLYYNHRDAAPTTIPAQVLTSTGVRKGAPGFVPASQPKQGLLQTPFSPQSTGGAPLSGGGPSFATPTTQPPPVAASTPKMFGTLPAAATPSLPFSGFGTKLGPAAATQSFTTVTPLFGTPTTTRFTATTKADTATTAFSTFGAKASGSQLSPLALTTATTTAAPSVSSSTQPFNLFNVSQVTPKAGGQGSTTQPTSLFGIPQSKPPSVFATPQGQPTSVFGTPQGQPTSVFGTPQGQQPTVFGTPQGQQTSVFGTPQGQQTSVFGTPQGQQTSVLGTPQAQLHAPSAFTAKTTPQSQANQGLTPPGNGLLTVLTSGSTPITSSYTGPSLTGSAQAIQQPATSNIEATVDSAFTQNIIEEITDFEKELKELRTRSKKVFMKVGTQEEKQLLRRETELMIQFCSEIKDATKDQQREAQEQKSLCFNLFAMAEECKASLQRESDPFYNSLLQKRVLDPSSAQKLMSVQQMAQTLEHSIVEVDRVLDAVWQEHLDKKRKEEKLHTPTGDTIFKTIKNNNIVIGSQREQLRKLENQLKNLKLYTTASNRDIDIVSSSVLNGDAPSPLKVPQNLGVTLASTVTNSMTPEKIARLRDILSQRKVPRVKSSTPANLSMSRIVAQTPGRSPSSTNSPLEQPKLPQRKHPLDSQQTPTGPPPYQPPVPTGLLKLANGQTPKHPASSQQGLSQSRIPQPAPVAQPGKNSTPTAFSGVAYLKPSPQTAAVTKPTAISSPAQVALASPFAVPGIPKQSQLLVGQTPVSSAVPTDRKPPPPPLTKQSQYYEDVTETDETNDEEDDYDEEDNGYEDEDDDEDESAFPGINEDGVLLPLPVRNDALPRSGKTLSQAQPQSPTLVPSGNSAFGTRGSGSGTFTFGTGITTTTQASSGTSGIFKVPQTSVPSTGAQAFTPVKSKTGQQVSSKDLFGAKTTAPAATTGGLSFGGPALFGNKPVPTAPSAGLSTVFGSNATPSRNVGFSDLSTKAASQGGLSASSEDSANLDKDLTSSQTSTGNVTTTTPHKSPGNDTHKSPAQAAADAFSFTGASAGTSIFGGNKASPNTSVFGGTPSTTTSSIFGGSPSTTTSSVFGGIPTTTSTGGSRFNFATTPGTATSSTPASSTPASSTTPTSSIFGLKGSADGGGRFSFGTKTSPSAPDSQSTSASTVATVKRSSADHPGNEADSTSGTVAPVSTSENISVTSTAATTPLRSTAATPPPSISTPAGPSFGAPTTTTSLFGVPSTPSSTPFGSTASVFGNNGAASSPFGAASTSTPSLFGGAATSSSSVFGSNATTSTSSTAFGGNTATSGQSLFGGAAATSAPSVFGGSATTSTPSLFGGANNTPSSSVFGGSAATPSSSVFGGSATTPSSSVFGGSAATPSSSVFGGNAASSTPSVFGAGSTSTVFGQSASKPLFGSTQASDSAPGFGTSNNSGSAFGGQSFVFGQQSGSAASSTSLFGQQSSTSGSTSLFGQAPAFGQQTSSSSSGPSFGFGGLGGKPSEEKAKQNVFGTPQVFGSPSTQSSNLFGSGGSNTFGSLGSTFSGTGNSGSGFSAGTGVSATGFGVSTQQSSGALGGSSVFGTAPSFGSSSGFGAKPAFSSLPAFGAAPAFGSAPAFSNLGGTSSTFGSTSSGGGFSSFASTQSPTFGQLAQTTPASPGFGSSTAVGGGFGSSQPNPSSPFGGGFGSGQSSFGGGTSLFGQAASSPGFGQAASNTGFGGAQPTSGWSFII